MKLFSVAAHVGFVAFLGLIAEPALAAELEGVVVGLADGDTVTVLDSSQHQHKIRLAGIDAPERHQAFGDRSTKHLAGLVFRKAVSVEWHKTDRYGRIVGKVLVDGVDAGLALIHAGFAWHYKQYSNEQTAEDREAYAAAEDEARARRVGLWRDAEPVAPWDFRRARR
jgi:endonuclease YncB( thermonuclease family)